MSFAGLVSSIRIVLDNDADRSRFTVLELAPHGNDREQWNKVKSLMDTITEEYGERLFARMVHMVPVVLQNADILSRAIASVISQRYGQQYGMIMGGWYALISDDPVTEKIARGIAEDLGLQDEKIQSQDTDEADAMDHVLTTKISIQDGKGNRREVTVGSIIRQVQEGSAGRTEIDEAKKYGILIESSSITIANSHATLRRFVFDKTRWSVNWARSIMRVDGAEKTKKRFDGPNPKWGTTIPFRSLEV
jgi:hypothetical protein